MRNRKFFRYALIITLALAASLSCNLIMNPINQTVGTVKTVQSVVTEAVGIATAVDIGGIVTSVGGIVTQVDIGGIVTQMGDISTQMGDIGGLLDNPTQDPSALARVPADIPLRLDASEVATTATEVTYTSDSSMADIASFYEREMPNKGWAKVQGTPGSDSTTLVYQKPGKQATVLIEDFFGMGTDVTITLQ
jgi:hypothetical protein